MNLKQPIMYTALVFLLFMVMLGGSSKLSAYPAQIAAPYKATDVPGSIVPDQHMPVKSAPPLNLSLVADGYAHEPDQDEIETQPVREINLKIRRGHNLFTILRRQGVRTSQIDTLARSINEVYNLRDLKPGRALQLFLSRSKPIQIVRLTYAIDATTRLEVRNHQGVFYTFRQSLHQDVTLPAPAAIETDIWPDLNASFLPYTEPLVADEDMLPGADEPTPNMDTEVRKTTERPTLARKSLRTMKMFLKAPLRYRRISSGYSLHRQHPIYHVPKPHLGIDYAAPMGTAVHSVGLGTVVFVGWSQGFGRCVHIRHPQGYTTYYGHLSRFAQDLPVGRRIEKGHVIGYVGRSGIATGPHLDFRVSHNGRFINPVKLGAIKRPV